MNPGSGPQIHASYNCIDRLRVRHALLSTGPRQAIVSLLGTDTCSRILPDNVIHEAMTLVLPREEKTSDGFGPLRTWGGLQCPELCDWTGTLLYSVTEPVFECAGGPKHMLAAKCVKSTNSAHSDSSTEGIHTSTSCHPLTYTQKQEQGRRYRESAL